MAVLKIARMGHPILRHPATPIDDSTTPEIRGLVDNMVETMEDALGIGLAAPQVHVPLRLVIFKVPAGRAGLGEEELALTILCNPVIEPVGTDMALGWEGCLSVPGMRGVVPRYTRIKYRGMDLNGQIMTRTAEGMHARVVQHECDHLDGILYPQRMTDMSLLVFDSEMHHMLEDSSIAADIE